MSLAVTDRIHLSEIRQSDQDALVEYLNDRDIYDQTLRIPFPYLAEDAQHWLGIVEEMARHNGQPNNWAIRNERGKLIGSVSLEGPGFGRSHRADLGYWLGKPFWGQGIMTAVVQRVCRHAFETIDLKKITAMVFPNNRASSRVLEKCGFELEGHLKGHFLKDQQLLDANIYGLLK